MTKIYNSPHFYNPDYKFKDEHWWFVFDYQNYLVSNMGRIKSIKRTTVKKDHILKQTPSKDTYLVVMLCNDKGRRTFRVHRLVCKSFKDGFNLPPEINHINGDKHDNRSDNLEWCTRLENARHAAAIGLYEKGENRYNSKLNKKDVIKIRQLAKIGINNHKISKAFGVDSSTIRNIVNRTRWKHVK